MNDTPEGKRNFSCCNFLGVLHASQFKNKLTDFMKDTYNYKGGPIIGGLSSGGHVVAVKIDPKKEVSMSIGIWFLFF